MRCHLSLSRSLLAARITHLFRLKCHTHLLLCHVDRWRGDRRGGLTLVHHGEQRGGGEGRRLDADLLAGHRGHAQIEAGQRALESRCGVAVRPVAPDPLGRVRVEHDVEGGGELGADERGEGGVKRPTVAEGGDEHGRNEPTSAGAAASGAGRRVARVRRAARDGRRQGAPVRVESHRAAPAEPVRVDAARRWSG